MPDRERYTLEQLLFTATRDRWGYTLERCPHCAIGAVLEHEDDADGNEMPGVMCCSWCDAEWEAAESKRGVTPS